MAQPNSGSNRIVFQTVDIEVSLTEIEYEYLKFVCHQTSRSSDEILRAQVRQLQIPETPAFEDWRRSFAPAASEPPVPADQPTNGTTPAIAEPEAVPKIEAVEPAAPTADPEPEKNQPRTRGRKKADKPTPSATPGNRRGGRGRKPAEPAATVVETPVAEPPAPAAEPPRRGGRRPKKAVETAPASLNTEAASASAPSEPETTQPKARRGRKPAASSAPRGRAATTQKTSSSGTGKRGRPPKR